MEALPQLKFSAAVNSAFQLDQWRILIRYSVDKTCNVLIPSYTERLLRIWVFKLFCGTSST